MNPPISNHHCLLRHDPVTARAISRLSHGVARLTASLNINRQHRHFRTRHAKSKNRTESESTFDDRPPITTGSKRKWQPDKIELDTIMELEHSTTAVYLKPSVNLPSSSSASASSSSSSSSLLLSTSTTANIESLQHVSLSIDALNLQTKPFSSLISYTSHPLLPKSLSSDHIETIGRYSSGSSMLSVTGSSDNNYDSDASSSHDADIEDADHGDLVYFKGGGSGGRSLLSRINRRKSSVHEKHAYELWRPMDSVYNSGAGGAGGGGDSSDGLSINIKIPRLSSIHLPNTTGLNCEHSLSKLSSVNSSSSYQQIKRNITTSSSSSSSMLASSSSDTNHCHRNRRNEKCCKCRLRNESDPTDVNHKHREVICNKNSIKTGSHSLSSSSSRSSSSSSSTSSSLSTKESFNEKYSKSFHVYKHHRCVDALVKKNPMNIMSHCKKSNPPMIKSSSAAASSAVRNDQKHDQSNLIDPNKLNYPLTNFTDSILNESIVDPEWKDILHTNKSSSGQMPTPPWMMTISDNESSFRDSDELNSDQRKLKKNTTPNADNNLRPCVDNWKIQTLCNAKPLNETNKGHCLLQKLGWKPGDKLGRNNQGLITPIHCIKN
ncbi:unnamed protein product [Schistosoma turkestanicum]|nr:unnamed protein product [Schistosoma turkestanicum]